MTIRILFAGLLLNALSASATTITYTISNINGVTWQYDYTVTNNTLAENIQEFTIYFDYTLYANLSAVAGSPTDWDSIEIQPDISIPDDGFYDSLADFDGIAPGQTLSGFSIAFDYLGVGIPGAQTFEIVDPDTFALLDQGTTTLVPLPAALWLLVSGIVAARAVGATRGSRIG